MHYYNTSARKHLSFLSPPLGADNRALCKLSNNASPGPVLSVCLRQDLSKLHNSVSAFGVAGIYYRQRATVPRKKTLLNSVAAATVTILLLDKNIYMAKF